MNLVAKKSLGQNFLINEKIINYVVDTANINNKDTIIEVGPGKGALTKKILEKKPKNFTVVEKDERFVKILKIQFKDKINIINKDMLKVSYEDYLTNNLIIFGNLPYNISTQILAKLIKLNDISKCCKKLILMFQKEVADRIIAKTNTKNYGRLSVLSNWKMKINKVMDIEPEAFSPVPKVKSSLLTFEPKEEFFKFKNPNNLEHVTNIFFSQRRKMIKKPLKFLFSNFEEVSKKLSIDLTLRPQNLDCLTYYRICEFYESSIY